MKYITHHRFKELALCGSQLNIPYGTELECVGGTLITPEGKAVCYRRSESGKKHFARNDDGRGLERGRLTHALAYSNRKAGNGFRFSKEEAEILGRDWGHLVKTREPRFPDALVRGYNEYITGMGGAMTWEVPVDEYGLIPEAFARQLRALRS